MTERFVSPAAPASPSPIACHTAVRRLWDFLDGELDAASAAEVEAHLATCVLCAPHFAFARAFLDAVAASTPAEEVPAPLRRRVLAALRAEGFDADTGGAGPPPGLAGTPSGR